MDDNKLLIYGLIGLAIVVVMAVLFRRGGSGATVLETGGSATGTADALQIDLARLDTAAQGFTSLVSLAAQNRQVDATEKLAGIGLQTEKVRADRDLAIADTQGRYGVESERIRSEYAANIADAQVRARYAENQLLNDSLRYQADQRRNQGLIDALSQLGSDILGLLSRPRQSGGSSGGGSGRAPSGSGSGSGGSIGDLLNRIFRRNPPAATPPFVSYINPPFDPVVPIDPGRFDYNPPIDYTPPFWSGDVGGSFTDVNIADPRRFADIFDPSGNFLDTFFSPFYVPEFPTGGTFTGETGWYGSDIFYDGQDFYWF